MQKSSDVNGTNAQEKGISMRLPKFGSPAACVLIDETDFSEGYFGPNDIMVMLTPPSPQRVCVCLQAMKYTAANIFVLTPPLPVQS